MNLLFVLVTVLLASMGTCLPQQSRDRPGDVTTNTFDYVVVGCGIAGLVVATRLSENPNVTVVCIEAGSLDNNEDRIEFPVYIGRTPPEYEWSLATVPQTHLDGKTRSIPMGRGVGGGSLVNGMIWNRGNQRDFDIWAQLGNPGWDWENLLPYFRKSETYTPVYYVTVAEDQGQGQQPVVFNPSVHGFSGPVNVSYPEYYWPQSSNWFDALRELNVSTCPVDPNEGLSAGGAFLPSSVDPTGQTRSDARRAYHDVAAGRPNYRLVADAQVGRVIFDSARATAGDASAPPPGPRRRADGLLTAVGAEVLGGQGGSAWTVSARREVILAAGAIHTPQLLELSGIGSARLLSSLNMTVLEDLPGVGNNLQDHAMVRLSYPYQNASVPTPAWLLTNTTFNAVAQSSYLSSRTGPWTSKPSTAVAFPSLAQITSNNNNDSIWTMIASAVARNNSSSGSNFLPPTYDAALRAGYDRQLALVADNLLSPWTPAYEILNDNAGGLDLALMRPLSRGATHVTSSDPTVPPAVDPRWLAHDVDFAVKLRAMLFNRRIVSTAALRPLQPSMPAPAPTPPGVEGGGGTANGTSTGNDTSSFEPYSDDATTLRTAVGTEYHYAGTAAMLPRSLGGVVDTTLTVYGTANLRIVDTSVFPVIPGAHLQAVAYAVAERAADLIKGVVLLDDSSPASAQAQV